MIKIVKNASVWVPTPPLLGDVETDKSWVLFVFSTKATEQRAKEAKSKLKLFVNSRALVRAHAFKKMINKNKVHEKNYIFSYFWSANQLFSQVLLFFNFISPCSQLTFGSNVFGDFKKLWNWGQLLTTNFGFLGQFSAYN